MRSLQTKTHFGARLRGRRRAATAVEAGAQVVDGSDERCGGRGQARHLYRKRFGREVAALARLTAQRYDASDTSMTQLFRCYFMPR